MKKSNIFLLSGLLLALSLIMNSCSKEFDKETTSSDEIVIKPTKIGNAINEGTILKRHSPGNFTQLNTLKSTEGAQFNRCEVHAPSLSSIGYYTNNNAKIIYIDYYNQPSGEYTGYYEYSYDSNGDITGKYKFDANWNLLGFCTYYWMSMNPKLIQYIAKWDANNNLLGFMYYTHAAPFSNCVSQIDEYDANSNYVQSILFTYSIPSRLSKMKFSNGDARTYTYDAKGKVTTATISKDGSGYSMIYYSRKTDSWVESSYLFGQFFEYDKVYVLDNNLYGIYDPFDPINIFNLNFYNL